MWCAACSQEFEGETCPVCGGALTERARPQWGSARRPGDLLKTWPVDEQGEHIAPAFLTRCSNLDMNDEMVVGMLSAYGIPCLRQYPNDGDFGRLILGVSGSGVDLFVPATLLEDARALLEGEPSEDDEEL